MWGVGATVRMHHLDSNKTHWEKAWWELHKNTTYYIWTNPGSSTPQNSDSSATSLLPYYYILTLTDRLFRDFVNRKSHLCLRINKGIAEINQRNWKLEGNVRALKIFYNDKLFTVDTQIRRDSFRFRKQPTSRQDIPFWVPSAGGGYSSPQLRSRSKAMNVCLQRGVNNSNPPSVS